MSISRRGSVAAARAAWLLVSAASALIAGACRDLVTDDVVDAETQLCGRLEACAIPGCDRVETFFASARDDRVDVLLATFEAFGCDAGCADAPICLDLDGICSPPGESCETDALCCGASGGEARCGAVVRSGERVEATCCAGLGVPCTRNDDCCALEDGRPMLCELPEGGDVRTCGGAPACSLLGSPCVEGAECCSGTCEDGVCDRIRCVPSGAPCVEGEDCCNGSEECNGVVCTTPVNCDIERREECPCGLADQPCTPGAPNACCVAEDVCVPVDDGAVCAPASCLPVGGECVADETCRCGGERPNAVCLAIASTGDGVKRTCQVLACTLGEGGPCDDEQRCCASSGLVCDAEPGAMGSCVRDCEPSSCERDPFLFGPPITPLDLLDPSDQGDAACVAVATCAEAVCAEDAYCCCQLWDEFCVEAAEDIAKTNAGACVRMNAPSPSP